MAKSKKTKDGAPRKPWEPLIVKHWHPLPTHPPEQGETTRIWPCHTEGAFITAHLLRRPVCINRGHVWGYWWPGCDGDSQTLETAHCCVCVQPLSAKHVATNCLFEF